MPFKLKLKKTRQYNVASKNLFVISVELLDGGVADCTLSVDSTGQECLDNVCQRQAITQPEFFGLRYVNRSQQPRWVQLERPLKRQLDKYASSHQLYLRVMYYVISGTCIITDEVTRYHYFLQLKNDLIEGRIICDCQQAVVLASYSRQAEYGNHDRERHTVEYLKNLLTFPKQMIDGGQVIDGATLAETGRLEWMTSAVIQHHMSLHNMSQAQAEEGFIKACQQLRGYGQEMFLAHDQRTQAEVTIAISLTGIMLLSETSDTPHFYRWTDITNVINHKRSFSIECARAADSASFTLRTPEDGNYVWRCSVQQHTFYMRHRAAPPSTTFQEHGLSESREELSTGGGGVSVAGAVGGVAGVEGEAGLQRAHSTSCLELERRPPRRSDNGQLLPSYRPAPDYETAIQQKYQQQRAEAQMRFTHHHAPAPAKPLVYGSHPDIHRVHYPDVTRHTINQGISDAFGLKYLGHNNYAPFAVNPNVQTELNPQLHYVNVYKPPPPYPSNGLASNSTPDLAVASQALNYHRGYNINSHVSGSSPDLVSTRTALNRQYLGYINTGNVMMNYGRPNLIPSTHGTYNNLASVLEPNPHIIIDPHHISDNIQKVYDERGNIMYSMPMHGMQYQRHVVLPQAQQIPKRNDTEPIYENVPLPWQSDKVTIRDRAQSLTTTDEISRLNERNSSHPTINNYGNLSKTTITVPSYRIPPKVDSPDSHYVNAQIIKDVRESSVPKDLNTSNRSINKEFENVQLSMDRLSVNDETPYQSLSTHKVNNNTYDKAENVTSISVPDVRNQTISTDSAFTSSILNSTYSTTDLETSGNTTKSSVSNISSKEKKRRRWGVFMGRSKGEVKSATLGRDKTKPPPPNNKHRWSTGLPKFQPLPPSITKETLCQILERKISDSSQLSFAFEQIPKGRETGGEMSTALLPESAALNGHSADSLPYEDNRVRLPPSPANRRGYINASHITMTVGSRQRFYILCKLLDAAPPAAPAPPATPAAPAPPDPVWQCWWGAGAAVIAAVGAEPQLPTQGQIVVRVESETRATWGGTRGLRVACGGRARAAWLVHYAAWAAPAQPAPPQPAHFLEFISEVNSLRLAVGSSAAGGETAPVVYAGGRGSQGGLALAADLLLQHLDNNQELDIPRTVGQLHQQRAGLVENVQQYRCLHQLLLLYLKQSRLI